MKQLSNKYLLLLVFLFSIIFSVSSQKKDEMWLKTFNKDRSGISKFERKTIPNKYELYTLNTAILKNKLKTSPKRKNFSSKSNTIVSFPNAQGTLESYEIFEASILEESLQKKYPNIKSYIGKGIENPTSIIRLSITPLGLHGMILQENGSTNFIDPYSKEDESYIIYSKNNLPLIEPFECKFDEINTNSKPTVSTTSLKAENATDGNLRTYRLAVATTGEYSQFHLTNQNISPLASDTEKKAAVLAAIVVTMTRVNAVFERDVALTMELVANNTNVIFLDAATDGFTNNDGSVLINESQSIIDANIGVQNYDIGHTFSTGGGGLAQLNSPCTSSKARGITGSSSPIGDSYDIDYVAHEMGHQFGAHHTFNGDAANCGGGNRNDATAVEPGSGSTIMAYAGICAPQNIQQNSDDYFHLVSIREMWANISSGNSSSCAEITATNNNAPTLEDFPNYTIPKATPFVLNATATDTDGDVLTYTWEQLDTEITAVPLVSTATGGPAFRSVGPSSSSMRYFPNQLTVNAGDLANLWEVLPTVERTMRFGVTVRDNALNAGQTVSDEAILTVSAAAGPFLVTSQETSTTWDAGTSQTITWDVASTNQAPVNCSLVNIVASFDGGITYSTILASNVINDGSHEIVVPNITSNTVRIKVESVGNVFYSVNKSNITIQASEFIMDFDSYTKSACVPNSVTYNFTYNTFLNFDETTLFSATGNPAGTTVQFNPASASNNNTAVEMTITGINNTHIGAYDISVKGTANSVEKTTITSLNIFSSTITATTLISPINNATNVLKPFNFSWSTDVNVSTYQIDIASDASFSTIIETAIVSEANFSPQNLQNNSTYYWRVKAINNCGESNYSETYSFTTENEVCNAYISTDVPKDIPDNLSLGVSSSINITSNTIIRNVTVNLTITHTWIGDLTLSLISPSGTSVLLSANLGDDADGYTNTTFDDDATTQINFGTAPFTGSYKPQGNLSDFFNEEANGQWLLKVVDSGNDDIGKIQSWSLNICGVQINTNDDDNDGVSNDVDQCPNTPSGTTVNELGCFALSANNFTIEATGETCPNKNNGQVIISATEAYNYSVTINGTAYNFTNTTNAVAEGLAPGTYDFCISVEGETYTQCYSVTIESGTVAKAAANITSNKATIAIEQGTAPYNVFINGESILQTYSTSFTVDVKHGDLLQVKTSVTCEGMFSKQIEMFETITAYPNPTNGQFEIALPISEKEITVELFSIHGQLISSKTYPVMYGKIQLNLENKPAGLYLAKVYLEQPISLKIIKQ
jgi:subtilisin-like proprotein convertase family protein